MATKTAIAGRFRQMTQRRCLSGMPVEGASSFSIRQTRERIAALGHGSSLVHRNAERSCAFVRFELVFGNWVRHTRYLTTLVINAAGAGYSGNLSPASEKSSLLPVIRDVKIVMGEEVAHRGLYDQ